MGAPEADHTVLAENEPGNIVALLHRGPNNSKMIREEYKIRAALDAGKTVCGVSIPIYLPNKPVPAWIYLFAVDSDGNVLTTSPIIPNPPGYDN
jgi:hypothetical protein